MVYTQISPIAPEPSVSAIVTGVWGAASRTLTTKIVDWGTDVTEFGVVDPWDGALDNILDLANEANKVKCLRDFFITVESDTPLTDQVTMILRVRINDILTTVRTVVLTTDDFSETKSLLDIFGLEEVRSPEVLVSIQKTSGLGGAGNSYIGSYLPGVIE